MEVIKEKNGSELKVSVVGRLDTMTSRVLEEKLKNDTEGIKLLTLDFSHLEYISSAGLQVLLRLHRKMGNNRGTMQIRGVTSMIRAVFDITGFTEIFHI